MLYVQPHQSEGHSISARDRTARPSSPLRHTALPRLKPSASFVLTWKQKLHALNLEDICNVLEIVDCCKLTHFVTSVAALLFL